MRNGLAVPSILSAVLIALLAVIYTYSPSPNVATHNAIIDSILTLKQSNNQLNKNLFEASYNRVLHYTYLSHAQQGLAAAFQQLDDNFSHLVHIDKHDLSLHLETLDEAITEKNNAIERFKQRHARYKNSLNYYPVISSEMESITTNYADHEFYERLAQNVIYYALTGEDGWRSEAESSLDHAENRLNTPTASNDPTSAYTRNFIAHSRLLIEGASALFNINDSNEFMTVDHVIDSVNSVNSAYLEAYQRASLKQESYQHFLSIVVVGLIFLVVYTLALVARNTIALAREKNRAQVTLASIANGVIVTDNRGLVRFLNTVAETLTECTTQDAAGRPIEEIFKVVSDHDHALVENSVRSCLRTGQHARPDEHALLITNSDNKVVVEHSASPIKTDKGTVDGVVMVFDDVTTAHMMARKLEYQATHDALTGLVNRREFENRANEALVTAKQDLNTHVLLYLDLDQFKIVNDTCGHVAGDELLKQVVDAIKGLLRASDTFARMGGDEFGILLTCCSLAPAERLAQKILEAVRNYRFAWDGKIFQVGVSIGVIPLTPECENLATVLSAADMACYSAKDGGRNRYHVFKPKDQAVAARKGEMNWVGRINDAMREDKYVLYGQKIVPIGRACNACRQEVLIRMLGDDGAHIPPGAFLPAAARYNVIAKLDRCVIAYAFQYYANQPSEALGECMLCINLSGESITQSGLPDYIIEQMNEKQVNPAHICFEITETEAVTNLNQAREMITTLRALGFKFALDDFGAGMSSFSYLRNLPVNYLKIDGALVKDIVNDEVSRAIVEMITRIAHIVGMETIAEFVENDAILAVLREIRVDYAQGYGIHRPTLVYTPQSTLDVQHRFPSAG